VVCLVDRSLVGRFDCLDVDCRNGRRNGDFLVVDRLIDTFSSESSNLWWCGLLALLEVPPRPVFFKEESALASQRRTILARNQNHAEKE